MLTLQDAPQRTVTEASDPHSGPEFAPVLIKEIELSQPLPVFAAFDEQKHYTYQRMRCLVRLHAQPLGLMDFTFTDATLSPSTYAPLVWQQLASEINAHLAQDGLSPVNDLTPAGLPVAQTPRCIETRTTFLKTAPFASVVISTRDRPDRLARCLTSLLAMDYPHFEIVVVDNVPSTSATADFIASTYAQEPRVRYVREDRPGLSAGRNRGILEARGEIIAITDDDVVVDTYWLAELARGFTAGERVVCVSGLLLPYELETPAQFLTEAYGGFTRGFKARLFDLRENRWPKPAFPYIVGACGTGASMAFTADYLRKVGGMNPALGTGTPTQGGEDLDIFFHVLVGGNRLAYAPASLLYHQHHRELKAIERLMRGYGLGFAAYMTGVLVENPLRIFDLFVKAIKSVIYLARLEKTPPTPGTIAFPPELKRLEQKGRLGGPAAYIRSRWSIGWRRTGLELAQESANKARLH